MAYDPEFYLPFWVHDDGTVTAATDEHAPEVFHDDDTDIVIESDHWEAFSVGYTQQYGYSGAIMHSSEQFDGSLRRDVLGTPGLYVLAIVDVPPILLNDDDEWPEPAGWTVLRKNGGERK